MKRTMKTSKEATAFVKWYVSEDIPSRKILERKLRVLNETEFDVLSYVIQDLVKDITREHKRRIAESQTFQNEVLSNW